MSKSYIGLVILIFILIIVGIFMTGKKTNDKNNTSRGLKDNSITVAVINFAAKELKVDPQTIEVIEIKEAEWPDVCFGLPKSGEFCAQVITPGYSILIRVAGVEYRYRTDKEGIVIIQEPKQ